MKIEKLLENLGYSYITESVNEKLKALGFNVPSPQKEYHKNAFFKSFEHTSLDINLTFNGYEYFKSKYGKPREYTEIECKGLLFSQFSIKNPYKINISGEELSNPFGFEYVNLKSEIIQSLKENSDIIVRSISSTRITFIFDASFQVDLYLNDSGQIDDLYVALIELEEKIRMKFELELGFQQRNITSANINDLKSFKNSIPILDWDYQSDTTLGTEGSKKLIMKIFNQFIDSLVLGIDNKDPYKIYYSVEDAVMKLNEAKANGFIIDTHEREYLCESVDELLKLTGFQYYDKVSITDRWRNW